jgi:hypothetical protein
VVSFSEDGGGESYHSYSSLYVMETFDDVMDFLIDGYYDWHQDSDCELCLQRNGRERCFIKAQGKLAKNQSVFFCDDVLSYSIGYDVYKQTPGTSLWEEEED